MSRPPRISPCNLCRYMRKRCEGGVPCTACINHMESKCSFSSKFRRMTKTRIHGTCGPCSIIGASCSGGPPCDNCFQKGVACRFEISLKTADSSLEQSSLEQGVRTNILGNGTMGYYMPAFQKEYGVFSGGNDDDLTADSVHIHQSFGAIDHQFEASLRSISNGSFQPSRSLGYEFMDQLYQEMFLENPCKSHMALHALNILQQDERVPENFRNDIQMFFELSSEMMAVSWKLFRNFEHASANWRVLQYKESFPDTASLAIRECPNFCFIRLIKKGIIPASGFNSEGQSFFRLACCEDKVEVARELLSRMSVEQIIEPASIMADCRQETVLELSTMNAELFNTCWTKFESNLGLDLSNLLKKHHYASICLFATEELAVRMLARGIDLAYVVNDSSYVTWPMMAQYHPRPASFFSWLSFRGCWPTQAGPDTPLLVAAQHDRFEATHWLLWNNHDRPEQWSCAIDAATRQTRDSACILELVMRRISFKVPLHPASWPQDIACKVIEGACNESRVVRAANLVFIEDLAIRKLKFVQLFAEGPLIYPKQNVLSTTQAGLAKLENFIRSRNREAHRLVKETVQSFYRVDCMVEPLPQYFGRLARR